MEKYENLIKKIESAYTEGITLDDAEKLAGEFLHAQLSISSELQSADLDSRMRKTGLKAVRSAIYMETTTKSDKKPTESALEHILNGNEIIISEQENMDKAEARRDELKRYYDIFANAHIFYRGIAKGKFE